MRTTRTILMATMLALTASCGNSAGDEPAGERIAVDVTVTLGPGCPVEQESVPCPTVPLTGYQVTATAGDDTVRRDLPADGRITLDLPAGTWTITADAGMYCSSATVSASGAVTIECDTGIR